MSDYKPTLLVIGAGIAGVSAALEAAETGAEVVLVERQPYIGGRVVRNHNYFPKMCPPTCGMEINIKRLERNPRVRVLTSTTVSAAEATATGWNVTLTTAPAFVNTKCTACGDCEKVCDTEVEDDFNLGMSKVKAIRLVHPHTWPRRFVFDRASVSDDEAKKIVESCQYDAIDLDAGETTEAIEVGAVVVATGWQSYPLANLAEIGGGVYDDVIANVQMERLATPSGPTGGKILRPSNGEPPARVAFVQCAGSRDVNHLPYCSGVCCLASLKQIQYVKEQLPEAEVTMYYIDRRTPGRNEDVLLKVSAIEGVRLVKGKVGKVEQTNGSLTLKVEDVEAGKIVEDTADLVVLATGMQPIGDDGVALPITKDEDGFILDDRDRGIIAAGVARRPEDVHSSVRDATGAVARAWAAAARRA
jgi:quinone-modifying oxidoreductase subunit QmoA